MEKNIKKGHPLWKILNPHVAKCSYSTMPNMASKIGSRNNKIEATNLKLSQRACSCPKTRKGQKVNCEWGGKCLIEGVVYKCEGKVKGKDILKWEYIGETGGNIKKRISNHLSTFKYRAKIAQTTLTEKMWEEKDRGEQTDLIWSRMAMARARGANQKNCNLCSKETLLLMNRGPKSLNKNEELGGYCPHKRKFLLCNSKGPKTPD